MSRIVVTGGSGFIGTNLMQHLILSGHNVINIDKEHPRNNNHLIYWNNIDILDKDTLVNSIKAFQPEYIYHLAARTDLNGSKLSDYDTNISGVKNIIESLSSVKTMKYIVFASSMLVCKIGYIPTNMFDYCPNTIYGESKVLGEKIVRNASIDVPWTIVRPTSIWGPWFGEPYRDFFEKIKKGFYFHPKGANIKRSYGFVLNAVFLMDQIAQRKNNDLVRETLYLSDYIPLELKSWSQLIQQAHGARPIKEVPLAAFKTLAILGDFLKIFGYQKFPMTSFRLRNMLTEMVHDSEKLKSYCSKLPYSVDKGVRITKEWLDRQEG